MIEDVDQHVIEWARHAVLGTRTGASGAGDEGDVAVSLGVPTASATGSGVGVYLMDLESGHAGRGTSAAGVDLWLHYLVTTWAEDPRRAHELLSRLIVAASETAELETDFGTLEPAFWSALGAPPQPHLVIKLPWRRERDVRRARLVQKPLVVRPVRRVTLHGVVRGPEDTPLGGARVQVESGPEVESDGRGRFVIGVPAQGSVRLRVRFKGRSFEQSVAAPETFGAETPLVVSIASMED